MRILCVEDEPIVAGSVRRALVSEGHAVDTVADGLEALDWVAAYRYDLILLDIVLPGLDGLETCRRIRGSGSRVPILMFTALDQVEDRVRGLDSGADDYLPKPFAMSELLARVRALLRRDAPSREATIHVGDLVLDPASHAVSRAGRPVRLTTREFALLEILARRPGQIHSRDRLIEALWDADFDAESNIVEVYIRSLRRKVDEGRRDGLIETVRGAGYRIRPSGEQT
jgi:DNA-binding response OmpR family regulator